MPFLYRVLLATTLTTIFALIINATWYEGLAIGIITAVVINSAPYLTLKCIQVYAHKRYGLEPKIFWAMLKAYSESLKAERLAKKENK